ncbi:MAG TPA: hypothetical protein VGC49_09185 [Solirubrobacterales bacterium]|jgi:hypothetical protein
MFAAILLVIAGVLNIIYGIAAIADANFFVENTRYVFFSLHAWGWITLLIGILQLSGGFSLFAGNVYGRTIGIAAASIGAIEALLAVGGTFPFWSLGIFALCVIVIHGLVVYGEPVQREPLQRP